MDGEGSKEKVLKENYQGKSGWRRVEVEGTKGELSREEWMEKG